MHIVSGVPLLVSACFLGDRPLVKPLAGGLSIHPLARLRHVFIISDSVLHKRGACIVGQGPCTISPLLSAKIGVPKLGSTLASLALLARQFLSGVGTLGDVVKHSLVPPKTRRSARNLVSLERARIPHLTSHD